MSQDSGSAHLVELLGTPSFSSHLASAYLLRLPLPLMFLWLEVPGALEVEVAEVAPVSQSSAASEA